MPKQKTVYEWRIEFYRFAGDDASLDFANDLAELRITDTIGYNSQTDVNSGWTVSLSKRFYLFENGQWEWDDEELFTLVLVEGRFHFNPLEGDVPKRFKLQVEKLNKTLLQDDNKELA